MKIGYLILNYKDAKRSVAAARMAAGLDAVKAVLIVDNCSPDDSWGLLQYAAGGKISVLRTEENGGYSYGNNIGVRSLSEKGCDIIAVANPDVSIAEENLLLLANALSDPVYAAVSGVEYDAAGQLTQPVLWRLKKLWRRRTYLFSDDLSNRAAPEEADTGSGTDGCSAAGGTSERFLSGLQRGKVFESRRIG